MKIYIFIVAFIASNIQAMDMQQNLQWNQDMRDAVTLLQGTSDKAYINIEKIKQMAASIVLAKSNKRELLNLHNSPPLLMISPLVPFDTQTQIASFVAKYKGRNDGKSDSGETHYLFSDPATDVCWVARKVNKKFNISAKVQPLFTPKIKLEDGGPSLDILYLIFIHLDKKKEYKFTFKGNDIISLSEKLIT